MHGYGDGRAGPSLHGASPTRLIELQVSNQIIAAVSLGFVIWLGILDARDVFVDLAPWCIPVLILLLVGQTRRPAANAGAGFSIGRFRRYAEILILAILWWTTLQAARLSSVRWDMVEFHDWEYQYLNSKADAMMTRAREVVPRGASGPCPSRILRLRAALYDEWALGYRLIARRHLLKAWSYRFPLVVGRAPRFSRPGLPPFDELIATPEFGSMERLELRLSKREQQLERLCIPQASR